MRERATSRIAEPRHPIEGIDPALARLSEMMLAVLSELTVMRERLDTVERLIERHGLFAQQQVEAFEPSAEEAAARNAMRKRQIQKVMRPLLDATERELRKLNKQRSAGSA